LTGLALMSSYYLMQWVVDGRYSATSQFVQARGLGWTAAAVVGGAVVGVFGAFAGVSGGRRPRLKALGVVTPAVVVGCGPTLWILIHPENLEPSRLAPAALVFALAGAALLVYAVRTCGLAASVQAGVVSVGIAAAALVGLLWLQTHGWLYLTF
jgi:hypothetical protein